MKISSFIKLSFLLFLSSTLSSCKKFLSDVEFDKSKLTGDIVYSSDVTAISAISGIYHDMINEQSFACGGHLSITGLCGLSSDEFVDYWSDPNNVQLEQNSIVAENPNILGLWQTTYKTIYQANAIIKGLENSPLVSVNTKKQLEGEARFVRAFCHFYLLNLFGDIPLILTTDYKQNAIVTRAPATTINNQIIDDLKFSQTNLTDAYVTNIVGERVRPNKATATALLARVYLYNGDWANAEIQASSIISNVTMYSLEPDLNKVFLKNSKEAIWQLKPVIPNINTFEGYDFIITFTGPDYYVLSNQIVNGFEPGDNRFTNWIGTDGVDYFPNKYKLSKFDVVLNEYSIVFRLAEQYLIRAEARAQQDKLLGINSAESDLNSIRNRAGLGNTIATTKSQILSAIEQERRVELFTEWGHRWLDLKRWNLANGVLGPIKPNWNIEDMLYPLPQSELNTNPYLKPQNPGY